MKKTDVIVAGIAICVTAAICLLVLIAKTKDPIPEGPPPDPYTNNEMFEILEVDRKQEGSIRKKMMAILTYTNGSEDLIVNQIANNTKTNLKYVVLDKNAKGNLLVIPHNINGTITISKLVFDISDTGKYFVGDTVFTGTVCENYGLLLKCDRPDEKEKFEQKYKYQIKLEQGEEVATYWISDSDNESGARAEPTQYIRQDLEGRDHTEWMNKNGLTTSQVVDEDESNEEETNITEE